VIRFAADENFNDVIVRALQRRRPDIDLVRIRDTELRGASDPDILDWAATEHRVLLTHDVTSMTRHAYERVRSGQPIAGVFEVSPSAPVGIIVEDIMLLAECSLEGEWEGQVRYLPLG
jgi:hypothetical protein